MLILRVVGLRQWSQRSFVENFHMGTCISYKHILFLQIHFIKKRLEVPHLKQHVHHIGNLPSYMLMLYTQSQYTCLVCFLNYQDDTSSHFQPAYKYKKRRTYFKSIKEEKNLFLILIKSRGTIQQIQYIFNNMILERIER